MLLYYYLDLVLRRKKRIEEKKKAFKEDRTFASMGKSSFASKTAKWNIKY